MRSIALQIKRTPTTRRRPVTLIVVALPLVGGATTGLFSGVDAVCYPA